MAVVELLQSKTAEIAAIISAALFPLGLVFLKKGYDHSSPFHGTVIVTAINAVFLWLLVLMTLPIKLTPSAIMLFILAGSIGHGIARYLQFTGVHRVGPARNTIALASSGLFGAVIAILFRGEHWTLPVFIGTIAIIAGVWVVAYESKKTKSGAVNLLYPLTAALLYGITTNIYKVGLEQLPNAIFAAAVGLTAAMVTLMAFAKTKGTFSLNKKSWPLFLTAGLINTVGLVLNFEAVKRGNVSVVFPLISSQPLFATLYGYLFLKQHEKITLHVVLGAIVVVAGIAIIAAA